MNYNAKKPVSSSGYSETCDFLELLHEHTHEFLIGTFV